MLRLLGVGNRNLTRDKASKDGNGVRVLDGKVLKHHPCKRRSLSESGAQFDYRKHLRFDLQFETIYAP